MSSQNCSCVVTGNQSNDNENDLQFDEIGNLGKKSENKFEN